MERKNGGKYLNSKIVPGVVPVTDAGSATRTTVGTVDVLLVLGQEGILGGAEGGDTVQGALAVSTLGLTSLLILVDIGELTT